MKKFCKILTIILMCIFIGRTYATDYPALPNFEYKDDDRASFMTEDNRGDIYVTGYSNGITSGKDICTVKYNSRGEQQWVAIYNGPGNLEDKAYAIVVDKFYDVIVTGYSTGLDSKRDIVTIKYDPEGQLLWAAIYDGSSHKDDEGFGLVSDNKGNIYVTGYSNENNGGTNMCTIKYSSEGERMWCDIYNGTGSGEDKAYAITIDNHSYIYVTGYGKGTTGISDMVTVKYDKNGNREWVSAYNGTGSGEDKAYAIIVDKFDNVIITGTSSNALHSSDYATVKYNSDGEQKWAARYSGPSGYGNQAKSIAVDKSCNIFVTGTSNSTPKGNPDYATIKYDPDGEQLWVARYNGELNSDDIAYSVALDKKGFSYVTGASKGLGVFGSYYHYATVKYNRQGEQVWSKTFTSSYYDDYAVNIVVDEPGNIFVTGSSFNPLTDFDYVTLAYDNFGEQEWEAVFSRSKIQPARGETITDEFHKEGFVLHQNSPNPFNPTTSIKFDVLRPSKIKLVIYNELGMAVTTPVDEYRNKGSYEVNVNMSNYASGIYFFVMTSNDARIVKKMILAK